MHRAFLALLLCLGMLIALPGCGIINNEYVVVGNYTPSIQEESREDGKIAVKNYAGLRRALLSMAYAGKTEGSIVFDSAYDGDTTEDMASACWAMRTQDALCAYCVENIAYEINKIVTINEANVYISYSEATASPEDISRLSFSYAAEGALKKAIIEGRKQLVLLVDRSDYSAEDMAGVITEIYRENPTIVPVEPLSSVNMYSGSGAQRLYEININYGLTEDEINERSAQLMAIDAFSSLDMENMAEADRAYQASIYLLENCVLSDSSFANTAYSALVQGEANSEGLAFAYVELCRQLGVDCRIVYGQYEWHDHCWNIVNIDGNNYHVDISSAISNGLESSFLRSDENIWGQYRWDVSAYPKCSDELEYLGLDY